MDWKEIFRPSTSEREREEKLGRVWGGIFVAVVVILTATIVGKACLFSG